MWRHIGGGQRAMMPTRASAALLGRCRRSRPFPGLFRGEIKLTSRGEGCRLGFYHGGIAQLGERLDGIEKVRGSSPLTSSGHKAMNHKGLWPFLFLQNIWT